MTLLGVCARLRRLCGLVLTQPVARQDGDGLDAKSWVR